MATMPSKDPDHREHQDQRRCESSTGRWRGKLQGSTGSSRTLPDLSIRRTSSPRPGLGRGWRRTAARWWNGHAGLMATRDEEEAKEQPTLCTVGLNVTWVRSVETGTCPGGRAGLSRRQRR